jgi:hypothetical protein
MQRKNSELIWYYKSYLLQDIYFLETLNFLFVSIG